MKWNKARQSDNVEDERGSSNGRMGIPFGKGGASIGGIAIIALVGWLMGESPMQILDQVLNQVGAGNTTTHPGAPQQSTQATFQTSDTGAASQQQVDFVKSILGDTEDTWSQIFSARGMHYTDPTLVLYTSSVDSGCGFATSATGPFYCPVDQKVYLDLSFFQEMQQQFSSNNDFARAYVIAHEVGHHVQQELGITAKIQQLAKEGHPMKGADGLSVRQELQADCFAGVWANHAQSRHHWLESGDVDAALKTASAIGDDRLEQQAQGRVVPDSFTHGTSEQRVTWFQRGFKSGDMDQCDTLDAKSL